MLMMINLFSNIYGGAKASCITPITPTFDPHGSICVDGYELSDQQNWCSYSLNSSAGTDDKIVVEIIQGEDMTTEEVYI